MGYSEECGMKCDGVFGKHGVYQVLGFINAWRVFRRNVSGTCTLTQVERHLLEQVFFLPGVPVFPLHQF